MKFTGLQPFGQVTGQIDVTIDGFGDIDLRNEAHIIGIRFLPGQTSMSLVFDFALDKAGDDRIISLEFAVAELLSVEPYLPEGVDPGYGNALLFGIGYWADTEDGREGFTVEMTTFEVRFYATEIKATVA
ncbi:hypothetical protein [Amycolatopsis sp. NPDC059657]|uniref:hypothetical protein n=1 Tax=Amycolatopsis sp. NPDC059657 TaxID=3346899 RepID=UPI00366FAA46